MATVYKFEITSHWIAYHPSDMKKMIEKALYSCENEITVRNLEQEQSAEADKSTEAALHKHIVSISEAEYCDCPQPHIITTTNGGTKCSICGKWLFKQY